MAGKGEPEPSLPLRLASIRPDITASTHLQLHTCGCQIYPKKTRTRRLERSATGRGSSWVRRQLNPGIRGGRRNGGDKEKDAQLCPREDFIPRIGGAPLADRKRGVTLCRSSARERKRCPARIWALTVVHVAVPFSRVELDRSQVELLRLGLLPLGERERRVFSDGRGHCGTPRPFLPASALVFGQTCN